MNRFVCRGLARLNRSRMAAVIAAAVLFAAWVGNYSIRRAHADEPSDSSDATTESSADSIADPGSTSPASGAATADVERIVGTWKCQTEEDGILVVKFTADGQLVYQFTEGDKDHNYGTFQIHDQGVLLYTPHDEAGEEHWTYGFDADGHLKLKMEQDDPKNEELYTMSRVRTTRR